MSRRHPTRRRAGRWFWPAFAGALCAAAGLVLAWMAGDREFGRNFLRGLIGFFTTPFILEATLLVAGICLVVAWNDWRRKRQGSDWVYLAEDDPHVRDGQAPGRHDAVFAAAPEPEPAELGIGIVEGLLDLEAWDEAGRRFLALPEDERGSVRGLRARLRLAEGLGQTGQAATLRARLAEASQRERP